MLTCFVQYLPYTLKNGDWEQQREHLGDRVTELIGNFAPNVTDNIVARAGLQRRAHDTCFDTVS